MAQFQGGFTFTETGAGAEVTAATLNALIGQAVALPGFITEQTSEATPADDDVFLMYDTSAAALRAMPGTRLIREWDGTEHVVTILHDGYEWDSRKFKSLSAIAKAITGTTWNGFRFFGLSSKRGAA